MTPAAASADAWRLRAMHVGPRPLILPNVWDPVSARAFADAGFGALATSSAAVAASLGYRDGQTPAEQMLATVARIAASVSVPVTADIENGYGLRAAELVARLAAARLAGCNLEDSDPAARVLTDPSQQADFIAAVRAEAGQDLVINARVDVFVREPARSELAGPGRATVLATAVDDAVARAGRYLDAGADCVYPIIAPAEALAELVRRIRGPVNAMFVPGGPSLAELAGLGIARITFGSGLHARAAAATGAIAADLAAEAGLAGEPGPLRNLARLVHDQRIGSDSTP
ncbi:MAG: isocitrate lyase/phosphoenolpyruvate mutase family protein [Streptosporangiaceae bacterium]